MQIPVTGNQSKLNNSIVKTKTELKAMNSRWNNAEEWINDLEGRVMEITQSEQHIEIQIKE